MTRDINEIFSSSSSSSSSLLLLLSSSFFFPFFLLLLLSSFFFFPLKAKAGACMPGWALGGWTCWEGWATWALGLELGWSYWLSILPTHCAIDLHYTLSLANSPPLNIQVTLILVHCIVFIAFLSLNSFHCISQPLITPLPILNNIRPLLSRWFSLRDRHWYVEPSRPLCHRSLIGSMNILHCLSECQSSYAQSSSRLNAHILLNEDTFTYLLHHINTGCHWLAASI